MQAERAQEAARTLLEIPVFVLFGIAAPVSDWREAGLAGWLFPATILIVRRAPWLFIAAPLTGFFRDWREKLFVGWFGPVGVAAIFYALLADRRLAGDDTIWPATSMVVMASIVAHGVLATPASDWLSKRRRPKRGA